ncbi:UPF0223 family protein [Facklamia sp. DSM 111018]|uniref:UPF0223 family protein n=1 Tax=Facklamia lactis TaxID=2749967 RepID=A0ABS0LRH6_9LACT|nr:UPF0223 family protein [Facklamia lactis]MBG9981000.1 UPF0223 family protein [Facklamia lactis]MBG9986637.1 UPF0223 family protein [Facklamia lactis]
MSNYTYPIDYEAWSTIEIAQVVDFFAAIETAYEQGISNATFKDKYRTFKGIVTSKSEEKQLDRDFMAISGYSIYRTVQKAQTLKDSQVLTMP